MVKKLTPAMEACLQACPFNYTTWGGKAITPLPKGVTMATITALHTRKLIRIKRIGPFERTVERSK